MLRAGAEKAFIVLRKGKWDIPAYFSGEDCPCLPLAFLSMEGSCGAPATSIGLILSLKTTWFCSGFRTSCRLPATVSANDRLPAGSRPLTSSWGCTRPISRKKWTWWSWTRVGRIRKIHIKPRETKLEYTWISAVWTPRFTAFMHAYLAEVKSGSNDVAAAVEQLFGAEVYMGDVIQAAVDSRMAVETVMFSDGRYIDIGTPEDLARAVRTWCEPEPQ